MKTFSAVLVSIAFCTSTAFAQTNSVNLSSVSAEKIIAGCKQHSQTKQQRQAIAVYDKGGNLVAALRMDGLGAGIMAFSEAKAKAVANWGFSTAQMEEAVKTTPGFADAPYIVTVAGGVPIFSSDGRNFVGSVGVSGAAPVDDAACAVAGIEAAGLAAEPARN